MPERSISEQSTVYHYTLVRKINASPLSSAAMLFIFAGYLTAAWLLSGAKAGIAVVAAIVAVPLAHFLFTRLYITYTKQFHSAPWKSRYSLPWPGHLPAGTVGHKAYRLWLHQLSLICAAVIALLYPWLPAPWFAALLFIHLWLILPRYAVLWSFRKLGSGGLIRFGDRDVSLYRP
ncbi:hypothetical protein [Gorillibacterium massiliense]|uniref:hypothetical protein n=1 Tax=Gorillibacterium massiliense TaxID=1280390 RepID=UPI0004B27D3E|nr:hypothetical protein [Gorillibacterium massiliense]